MPGLPWKHIGLLLLVLNASIVGSTAPAADKAFVPLAQRTAELADALRHANLHPSKHGDGYRVTALEIEVDQCSLYPYAASRAPEPAARQLIDDLADGLETGLRCLGGSGPMGRLHPYHEYQAHRLLNMFKSAQTKTFQCVDDAMFATAVATSPQALTADDPLYAVLRRVEHPAVILDTFRLGGLLSRQHDDETYRRFFHLGEEQILEHRNGQPLRSPNLHRYQDRPALLFHEVVHWLGHQHSAIYPDLAHLYETCCFGGSDYIEDAALNRAHQQTACNILKDDALWAVGHYPYRQMRVWHHKNYDGFKSQMRADYAR